MPIVNQHKITRLLPTATIFVFIITIVIIALALLGPAWGEPLKEPSGHPSMWNGVAKAWVDENENGIWDNNELPLSGVKISSKGLQEDSINITSITDSKGQTLLTVWGDSREILPTIKIIAESPFGYHPTTPSDLQARAERVHPAYPIYDGGTYLFGFARPVLVSIFIQNIYWIASLGTISLLILTTIILRKRGSLRKV